MRTDSMMCNIPVIYQRLKQQDADGRCPDIVLCSRFMEGSAEYSVSATKKLAYGFFRWMIKISTGRKIADPTTGLQGLNRRAFYITRSISTLTTSIGCQYDHSDAAARILHR